MHGAIRIAATAALAAALFLGGAVGLTALGGEGSAPAGGSSGEIGGPVLGGGTTTGAIASLQQRLRTIPGDWRSYASLGIAYVSQARASADPSYYPKAEGVLRRSLSIQPEGNLVGDLGMGSLALARHDFTGALAWGERARSTNPEDADVYGVIGDAQLELGRYRDAFASFQKMVDTKPELASYARVSYARELQGDTHGAAVAMRAALDAAGSRPDAAWAGFQLGELAWNRGDLSAAAGWYRRSLDADPTYAPPSFGLAKVAWARGDERGAIRLLTSTVQRYPLPEYVIWLGDMLQATGDHEAAARQYQLVDAIRRLFAAGGVDTDLELAVFDAEHGDPATALRAARAEWGRRRSIHVADALAWALHENGNDRVAATYARRALRLGTGSALFEYHAGMIQLALGRDAAARSLLRRALATNPSFSIFGPAEALRALDRIGSSR